MGKPQPDAMGGGGGGRNFWFIFGVHSERVGPPRDFLLARVGGPRVGSWVYNQTPAHITHTTESASILVAAAI
jgi:hypothetical protein